jgi:hypothetical protein
MVRWRLKPGVHGIGASPVAGSFHINALPFSCKGRYVMVDSSTAGAARRPSFIPRAVRPRLVDRRPRVDRPLSAATAC